MNPNLSRDNHVSIVLELGVNGLGVVRSLGKKGLSVVGVYTEDGPGRNSKYCHSVRLPDPSTDEDGFLEGLTSLCQREKNPPVIFPTNDKMVQFMLAHRDLLKTQALFNMPDPDILDKIINKDGTYELAKRCDIPAPRTYIPKNASEVLDTAADISYPCIFKPRDTFSVEMPDNAKNLVFENRDELLETFSTDPDLLCSGVLQDIILGGDGFIYVCAGYFNQDSNPLAFYTGRKIRQYLPDVGVTCFGESLRVPQISKLTFSFLKDIKYQGLAAVEYTRDRDTGEFYFLEINARSYYHNSLFQSCGVNLPYTAFVDLVEGNETINMPVQRYGIRWIDFQRDFGSFWRKRKNGDIGIGEWLISVCTARSFAVFDKSDLKPFFYSVYNLFVLLLTKIIRR